MVTGVGSESEVDAVLAAAVDLTRDALLDFAGPGEVGEHLAVRAEGDRTATHYFACLSPAYQGWTWAVTVARAPRARTATVCETVLLPGDGALLAPPWLPWSARLRPGDLGVGDLLPTREDDPRLEPGWNADLADLPPALLDEESSTADVYVAAALLDLSRPRVLSPIGRDDAVDRWYAGESGPESALALAAPASCRTCGFLVTIGGSLGQAFGLCANEYSPSDGRVVALDHGCGAHSEAAVLPSAHVAATPVVDEVGYDLMAVERLAEPEAGPVPPPDTEQATDPGLG